MTKVSYIDSRIFPAVDLDITKMKPVVTDFCSYLINSCPLECDEIAICKIDIIDREYGWRSKYNARTLHFFVKGVCVKSMTFDNLQSLLKFRY